jgi:SynChlorMet cassette protein ScmC
MAPEYCLMLSDGSGWCLTGDEHTFGFVDKLANIMELERSSEDGWPKLVFSMSGNTDRALNGTGSRVTPKWFSAEKGDGWCLYNNNPLCFWWRNDIHDVVCEIRGIRNTETELVNMWLALQPIYQRSISSGGLPFHAGLAELNGQAILMAASGDKGKSTCCRRLPDYWQTLCDDEALVVLGKEKGYRAHPFPTWSDYLCRKSKKTWNVQHSVPLSGVFFIEQAETDEVELVGEGEAALLITDSATQICQKFWRKLDKEDQKKFREELFNNACEMAREILVYRLFVSLHGRFWEKIE